MEREGREHEHSPCCAPTTATHLSFSMCCINQPTHSMSLFHLHPLPSLPSHSSTTQLSLLLLPTNTNNNQPIQHTQQLLMSWCCASCSMDCWMELATALTPQLCALESTCTTGELDVLLVVVLCVCWRVRGRGGCVLQRAASCY